MFSSSGACGGGGRSAGWAQSAGAASFGVPTACALTLGGAERDGRGGERTLVTASWFHRWEKWKERGGHVIGH